VSTEFGFDRGRPVDRYYIERFLSARDDAIRGRVLEFGEPLYTNMFGDRVTQSEILDVAGGPAATYTCRLETGDELPSEAFDCVIFTQTLQYIYDVQAGLRTLHRILRPGGTVLATVPGITRICQEHYPDSWFWSFTAASVRRLFSERFTTAALDIEAFGNVLAATAFLYGLADSDLAADELDHNDPDYEVIIGVRAQK
jgi:SAM-dependent methyltransferase